MNTAPAAPTSRFETAETTPRTLRLRAIGSPGQLAGIEPALTDAFARWAPVWRPPLTVDIRYFHARPELHGHVLILGECETDDTPVQVAGCDLDPEAAANSCVGELVERQCSRAWINPGPRQRKSTDFEDGSAFSIADYLGTPVFPDRWPYPRYTAERLLTWTRGCHYLDGEPIWVPESLVGLCPPADTERLGEVTTVGLAAGATARQAAAHGLHELLERATVMHYWQTHEPMELLCGRALDDYSEFLSKERASGWHTQLLQARSPAGTGVVVALTRHTEIPAFGVGLSAHPLPYQRIRHALAEMVQIRLLASLHRGRSTDTLDSFEDHLLYYCHPDRFSHLDSLVGTPTDEVIDRRGEDDTQVVERLVDAGSQVAVVELTNVGTGGPAVTRVLATRLPHMEVRESCARLPVSCLAATDMPGPYRPHPYP
ncbi:YcaO-like family protein [Nocardia terpenica]|uniref:YcaO-like family protein n=1 Tax=Nocardia terpenica TaxID=455432 RepID=UPI001894B2BA|nr:YcaO-like family protein [Nocardia terpenica]MBF6066074.1 YcaO-like family protein [Nocardia terpenica]MBF6109235.1 YcaO-like family protein [Nocardia terpenica]MBF6116318.1 YcaO-like family protein [Nocardia terpenica]MBF6123475.1 YcaO-like family protein [Nocardia terpenica]MBF6156752.1 YcaO-like family protein [Nocardia terpenica]